MCVELADGARLSARLLVAADSRFSSTRRLLGIGAQLRDFGKTMLVCRVRHAVPHHHAAWEWFGYGKTLALLPLKGNRAGAVLTLPPRQVEALLAMDARAFGAAVTDAFEHRLGPMQQDGSRHAYPLIATYAQQFAGERAALIGDAAVGMHPVTAHGFNFGLQSQARLAERVLAAAARGGDIGAAAVVQGYARAHVWRRARCMKQPMHWPRCTPTIVHRPACCDVAPCVRPMRWRRSSRRLQRI